MGRVQDKVALVTGAGRGQGRSHALRLAEEGADIIALDICHDVDTVGYPLATSDDLAETVKMVDALGRRAVAVEADVRDAGQVHAAVQTGLAEFGRIDIVAANAGVTSYGKSWELTEDAWDAVVDTNLKGVWQVCKAVIPSMIEGGRGGSIVITSSAAGLRGQLHLAHYTAAKHGLSGLARTMAGELAEHMIRVNTVCPTSVDTPMVHNQATYDLFIPDPEQRNREGIKPAMAALNMLPVAWVAPRDISNAVLFLATDEARYITAIDLPVDAGCTQRML
jgi:SDR family mycofactocin-dependent oxidoreductase